jgi:hypothetical protein
MSEKDQAAEREMAHPAAPAVRRVNKEAKPTRLPPAPPGAMTPSACDKHLRT